MNVTITAEQLRDHVKLLLSINQRPIESMTLQLLAWDTKILGLKCARIDDVLALSPEPLNTSTRYAPLVTELRRAGVEYVTIRRPSEDWLRNQCLEEAGFRLVDGIIDFVRPSENISAATLPDGFTLRLAAAADAEKVAELCPRIFTKSRFHNDPLLDKSKAAAVHAEWGRNSCLGVAAEVVWLVEKAGKIAGLVTCKRTGATGRIILIGVDPAFAGNGLGTALISKAGQWFKENHCREVRVQTQVDNFAALRLYARAGFAADASFVTLRWWGREK